MSSLIGRLSKERSGRPAGIERRADPAAPAPLLPTQRRIWLLDRLEPGSPAYVIAGRVDLDGALDVDALTAAVRAVVTCHEALRSCFPANRHGVPEQIVSVEPVIDVPVVEVADEDDSVAAEVLERARQPFDLTRGPVFRAVLLRRRSDAHVLVVAMHHIVADGWSLGIILRDLVNAYRSSSEQAAPHPTPAAPAGKKVQLADVAAWHDARKIDDKAIDLACERLAGVAPLELPTDFPRPPVVDDHGARTALSLPSTLAEAIRMCAREHKTTVFTVLATSWSAVLARFAGQTDFAIGMPVAKRNRRELEDLVGCLIDTRVLRIDTRGEPSLLEQIERFGAQMSAPGDDVSFEHLVDALEPMRARDRTPVFQAMVTMNPSALASQCLGTLQLAPRAIDVGSAKVDVTLELSDAGEGAIDAVLEYRTALFEPATVDRWANTWLRVLEAAVAAPTSSMTRWPWLDQAGREQIATWSRPARLKPASTVITDRIATQGELTPEATAVVAGDHELSYREMVDRTRQLAHLLHEHGVTGDDGVREQVVGVCWGRDEDLPVILLGVLESGAAYVALDPAYPAERLRQIVDDADPVLVLTRDDLLPEGLVEPSRVLDLERHRDRWYAQPSHRPDVLRDSERMAYLIYTSGSTGRPKGVAIRHRGVAALTDWAEATFSLDTLRGVGAVTSINFDLSTFELLVPLALGGTSVVMRDALALAEDPTRERVRLVNTVPSAMTELLRLEGVPPHATDVILAGEPLRRALVDQVHALPRVRKVMNAYGPSEDTTYTTIADVPVNERSEPVLGLPIDGTHLHVLDAELRPVPIGVVGQVFLSGTGVARGYLGLPRRTAESFVPDPFATEPGGRLYRTGDLVRRDTRGGLVFLGRVDHQVKLRGFRIELGEIEAVLDDLEGVHDAVVKVEGSGAEARLVAFVGMGEQVSDAASSSASLTATSLSTAVAKRLPKHMVPAVIVVLEALPRLPNGKINRGALRAPEGAGVASVSRPPSGPVEEQLARLFAEVLGRDRVDQVGADDHFFALGGHSLLAARVVARIREAFGRELPLATLFDHPTVAELATVLAAYDEAENMALPELVAVPRDRDLPLSFAQERLWFLDKLTPGASTYHMLGGFRLRGRIDRDALEEALSALVARHESLRTTFHDTDDGPVQRIASPEPMTIVVHEVDDASGHDEAIERLAQALLDRPFDLATGPLLRVEMVRLAADEHVLWVDMHHIVSDGWSIGVFCDELSAGYRKAMEESDVEMPDLAIGAADVAVWQRRIAEQDGWRAAIEHFRVALDGLEPLRLPTDRPRPASADAAGDRVAVTVTPILASRIEALARAAGTTPFVVVTAAYAACLARWAGVEDLAIGTPAAQRDRASLESLIGFFVNTLVLRADVSGDPSFSGLLDRLKRTVGAAFAHQQVPFEKLVEVLDPPRDPSTTPLVQTMVAMQTTDPVAPSLPGVAVTPCEAPSTGARFDLTLMLTATVDGGFDGGLEYRTSLFDRSTMVGLARHLVEVLEAVASDAEQPLSALPLPMPGEVRDVPAVARREDSHSDRLPTGEWETRIAAIFETVLDRTAIRADDDFFALGGHSLLATRVVARIRSELGVDLPLTALFEQPTVARLASRVAELASTPASASLPPIQPVDRSGDTPLSLAQNRLWFLDQLEGSVAYHIPAAVRLDGPLDGDVLERALAVVEDRHEALRTVFVEGEDERPVQVVKTTRTKLQRVDLANLDSERRELALDARLRDTVATPFDLATGPLMRTVLVRLAAEHHVLLVVLHHIVADGWSAGILIRELGAAYRAELEGVRPDLPELPIQYGTFATWQERHLDVVLAEQLDAWRHRLAGVPTLDLPTDRPRPAVRGTAGAEVPVTLDPELVAKVDALATTTGTTRFMILMAVFQALLGRWADQRDFAVGTPVAGRTHAEIEPLIGFFVNTLALRADLSGDPSLRTLLARTRATALEAQDHQDVPFEKLVGELEASRDRSRTPLFQVMFALQNNAEAELDLPGIEVATYALPSTTAKVDLHLSLTERTSGESTSLVGTIEYATELFDRATVTRLAERFSRLLDAALAQPEMPVSALPWLDEDERTQVLDGWNGETIEVPAEATVDSLIAECAARQPERDAVVGVDETLTYAELERRVDRLARHLRSLDVGTETVVGVCLPRTPMLVVTLLAVHRAGAAYVALDPAYPADRLSFMVEDSGAAVVVTDGSRVTERPGVPASTRIVDLATVDLDGLASTLSSPTPPTASADRLSHLIYTSGSTGRPKGVAISHRSAVTLLAWARRVFDDEELGGLLAATSINFDLSVFELFSPLAWGGTVILADNVLALATHPARDRVHMINTVPSAISALLATGQVPDGVRSVGLAGEPLRRALVEDLAAQGIETVYNLYGPSEDTTYSTWARVPFGDEHGEPTIGVPVANTRAYVLDASLRPVPVGAIGELWLSGDGVARGYHRRPGLTAERFVPDPHADEPGARIYRTGDRVRWRADGELLFLGRADHQVKIRGFRIEPGEIEAALISLPQVTEVVVGTVPEPAGGLRLVAWLSPAADHKLDVAMLRDSLGDTLPAYMVPGAFVVLDDVPKLPNGKIDRRALPAPKVESEVAYEAPTTPTEKEIATLFADLLGSTADRIGRHDDFFALGGHSLLATQLVSRLRDTYVLPELSLDEVFRHPTVAGMALAITQMEASATDEDELAALLAELALMSEEEVTA
ncbi:MAG: amino acid adenylation domain-containing protein [Acidobacteriota bacterium]